MTRKQMHDAVDEALIRHHLEDFYEGRKMRSVEIMVFSLKDAGKIINKASADVQAKWGRKYGRAIDDLRRELDRRMP